MLMHRVQGSEAWNGGERSQGLESGHRPLTPGFHLLSQARLGPADAIASGSGAESGFRVLWSQWGRDRS